MAQTKQLGGHYPTAMISERRTNERVPVGVYAALFSEAGFHIGLVENISSSGLFVSDLPPFMPGNLLRLSLILHEDGKQIRATARVLRLDRQPRQSGQSTPGLGLEFTELEGESRELVENYIAEWHNKTRKPNLRVASA